MRRARIQHRSKDNYSSLLRRQNRSLFNRKALAARAGQQLHPEVIVITQPTELGTLYTLDEIRALESEVDAIEQGLYRKIFKLDMGLAERTQLASFVDLVADLSDIIENIADKIQIMIISKGGIRDGSKENRRISKATS